MTSTEPSSLALRQAPAEPRSTVTPLHPQLGRGWIDLPTAARRSGRSLGGLRRLCGDVKRSGPEGTLAARSLAKQLPGPDGGRPEWWVSEQADAAFAPVKFSEQMTSEQFAGRGEIDLRKVGDAARRTAEHRLGILRRWNEAVKAAFTLGFGRNAATGRFIERLLIDENLTLSRATLYLWDRAWRSRGLAGLLDGRGHKPVAVDADDPFIEETKRLYLSLRQPKLSKCYELAALMAQQHGWKVCSYEWVRRAISAIPKGVLIRSRMGEDAYVEQAEPSIAKDYTTLASNEAWNADHHQFDVAVDYRGKILRPWLSAIQDVRSRKIMGWVIVPENPNASTILQVFRAAVLAHGVPQKIFIDNGKDYDAMVFNGRTKKDRWARRRFRFELDQTTHGLWNILQIDPRHVWPYHGQSKPIERWFGELEQHTFVWPTYCGNAPENRPRAREGPMRKEDFQLNVERGHAPTLAEFTQWFADWLTHYEAGHQHSGDGMDGKTPDVVYAEQLHALRTTTPDLLELYCMPRIGPVKVHKNGVTYQGLQYGQFEPAIAERLGRQVMLAIDERNVGASVHVYDLDGKPVCIAPSNIKMPFIADAQELREAIKAKKQDRKVLREYIDRRPRMADDLPDRMIQSLAAKSRDLAAAANTPGDGPSIRPLQTPLDDDLRQMRKLIDQRSNAPRRLAIGGESIDPEAALPRPGTFVYRSQSTEDSEES